MSTLLKTTSKAASKSKKNLPRSDIRAAEQDMALEAGIAMSGEEDSDEEEEDDDVEMVDDEEDDEAEAEPAAPVKKSKKVEKGKGKELKKKVVVDTTTVDKVDKAVQRRKDKVLMLSSRGITGRMRHLMLDLEAILPHLKKGKPRNRLALDRFFRQELILTTFISPRRRQIRLQILSPPRQRTRRPPLMQQHPLL
jgi:hypothetical protein